MTPMVCLLAGLLAAPNDYDSPPATAAGELEIVIPLDRALVATLESGDDIVGEIPPQGRRATQYRLRTSPGGWGAPRANLSSTESGDAGQLELLIPVDAALLSRLSGGVEVIGEIPATAVGASRYRLQLVSTSSLADSATGQNDEARSATSPYAVSPYAVSPYTAPQHSVTTTAGAYETDAYAPDVYSNSADTYAGTSGLPLPGPERTNSPPPAVIDSPPSAASLLDPPGVADTWTTPGAAPYSAATEPASVPSSQQNLLAPIVSSATDLVSNTVAAAKSILHLPPPPSESESVRPEYQTMPQVSGVLDLPPPPGTYSSQIPAYDVPTPRVATTNVEPPTRWTGTTAAQTPPPVAYTPPDNYRSNLVPVPSGPRTPARQPGPVFGQSSPASEKPAPAVEEPPAVVSWPPTAAGKTVPVTKEPAVVVETRETAEKTKDLTATDQQQPTTKTAPVTSKLASPGTDVKVPDKEDIDLARATTSRPWAALSFSLLGLCISLGGNFFLGWIAWSHRHRYLDLLRKTRRERVHKSHRSHRAA